MLPQKLNRSKTAKSLRPISCSFTAIVAACSRVERTDVLASMPWIYSSMIKLVYSAFLRAGDRSLQVLTILNEHILKSAGTTTWLNSYWKGIVVFHLKMLWNWITARF
jgi:hypothetical protein